MQTLTTSVRAIPEQISELREEYPQSIALSYHDRRMSYEELDRGADRFAWHLEQFGVMSGGTVAICMERSFEWIVAALGIMKAGAAFVPLDPAWPDSRLRFAVNDSGATALVARTALLDRLQVKTHGIDPYRDAAAIAANPFLVRGPIEPESVAYVIYTSGSTGVPKGVEITHANLTHHIRWHRNAFSVTRQDRASHLAGLGFDAAIWEIWPNLSAGATVCLADNEVRSSPESMQQWMIRERVTIGFVPTVNAKPMMTMEWPAATALRFLLTGGETLHHGPPAQQPFEVVNNYGPTECTVVATSSVLMPGSHGMPPIGRPIAGTSVYLLNEGGEQVPDGGCGEIYIGGGGVGRGYRNLPDITARSFMPDPFVGTPGARMYRTGDRGVRRPDGEIEFRGRLDRQTKIRGRRVELDEIGSILTIHPSVDFAVAISQTSEDGDNRLVAYVLPRKNADVPTTHELRKHLRRSLPDYMIPAVFVRLQALPLSPNGKLDLTILEQQKGTQLFEETHAKTTDSPIEEKLLTLMRELLEQDSITVHDNFFLAGGHSLLGMQLLMLLRKAFGVEITSRQLFEAPTVERLAALIETRLGENRLLVIWEDLLGRKQIDPDVNIFDLGGTPELVAALQERIALEFGRHIPISELSNAPTLRKQAELTLEVLKPKQVLPPGVLELQPNGSRERIFWVHYQTPNLAKVVGDDQPFFSVGLTEEDVASLGESPTLESIATCLVGKILATQSRGPYVIGGFCLGGVLAYEIACQLRAAGNEISLLVLVDAPDHSFFKAHSSWEAKLSQPGYLLKRLAYLGPRGALVSFRKRLFTWLPRFAKGRIDQTQLRVGQERIEVAASSYRPRNYEGRVLLLMASVRAPHINFLPGWQTCVPFNLHAQYLEGHHNELTSESNVQSIAAAIASHLTPSTGEVSLFCHTSACASTGSAQAAKPAEMWDSTRDGSTRARAGNSTLSAK